MYKKFIYKYYIFVPLSYICCLFITKVENIPPNLIHWIILMISGVSASITLRKRGNLFMKNLCPDLYENFLTYQINNPPPYGIWKIYGEAVYQSLISNTFYRKSGCDKIREAELKSNSDIIALKHDGILCIFYYFFCFFFTAASAIIYGILSSQ